MKTVYLYWDELYPVAFPQEVADFPADTPIKLSEELWNDWLRVDAEWEAWQDQWSKLKEEQKHPVKVLSN